MQPFSNDTEGGFCTSTAFGDSGHRYIHHKSWFDHSGRGYWLGEEWEIQFKIHEKVRTLVYPWCRARFSWSEKGKFILSGIEESSTSEEAWVVGVGQKDN